MDHFKTCSKCSHTWRVRDDFLEDPSICLVGFQASFVESEPGYYLFNHILDGDQCNTTLMVKVEDFLSLHKGSMFTDIKFETAQCEGIAPMSEICPNVRLNVKIQWPVKSCRNFRRVPETWGTHPVKPCCLQLTGMRPQWVHQEGENGKVERHEKGCEKEAGKNH
jgi:hypothetical protein